MHRRSGGGQRNMMVIATAGSQPPPWPSCLGLIIWLGGFAASALWWTQAHNRYLRLLQERRVLRMPATPDNALAWGNPSLVRWGLTPRNMRQLLNLFRERQADPELERARREDLHRYVVTMAVGVGGILVPVALTVIEYWVLAHPSYILRGDQHSGACLATAALDA